MAKKFVIIDKNDVSSVDFSQVMEHSTGMLRYNKDKTKTFVKFEGNTPSFLEGETQYTLSEMLSLLNNTSGEWYIADGE
tara:strand:- start:286 stop:522 length:237 start_codon:yes stop_codon:yes gene_type:complete